MKKILYSLVASLMLISCGTTQTTTSTTTNNTTTSTDNSRKVYNVNLNNAAATNTFMKNSGYTPREAAEELAEAVNAEVVTVIGTKFVLYRESEKHKKISLEL